MKTMEHHNNLTFHHIYYIIKILLVSIIATGGSHQVHTYSCWKMFTEQNWDNKWENRGIEYAGDVQSLERQAQGHWCSGETAENEDFMV